MTEAKLAPRMSTIQWWGICTNVNSDGHFLNSNYTFFLCEAQCPEIQASVDINHSRLSIMVSSDHLKGDIIEACQCVKCTICHCYFMKRDHHARLRMSLMNWKLKGMMVRRLRIEEDRWDDLFPEASDASDGETDEA